MVFPFARRTKHSAASARHAYFGGNLSKAPDCQHSTAKATCTTLLGLEFHFRRSNCILCLLWIGRHRESKLRLPKRVLGRRSFRNLLNFGNLSLNSVEIG